LKIETFDMSAEQASRPAEEEGVVAITASVEELMIKDEERCV
jgi:hypothetical protein